MYLHEGMVVTKSDIEFIEKMERLDKIWYLTYGAGMGLLLLLLAMCIVSFVNYVKGYRRAAAEAKKQ